MPKTLPKASIEEETSYILLKSLKVSIEGGWTCPAKTFAIFLHDIDDNSIVQNYYNRLLDSNEDGIPESSTTHAHRDIIGLMDNCKTIQDVRKQVDQFPNEIPPIRSTNAGDDHCFDTWVEFDQNFYLDRDEKADKGIRLACWFTFDSEQ